MRFPLEDVTIEITDRKREVDSPVFKAGPVIVGKNEVAVTVEGVAHYFAKGGKQIVVTPEIRAEAGLVEHFLNSWGLVSILHQRRILNFHASAVEINGTGVMICGDSGAGKSSLTAALQLAGGRILTDDITPVVFRKEQPFICLLTDSLALKTETLNQLKDWNRVAFGTNPLNGKKLFRLPVVKGEEVPLSKVIWLNVSEDREIRLSEVRGIECFTMLRSEICGWEMLKGMKETEAAYMKQLALMGNTVKITKVERPGIYLVEELARNILPEIHQLTS